VASPRGLFLALDVGEIVQDAITSTTVSVLKFVISTVLWSLVLFNLGRAVLLLFTLGRYPRGPALRQHSNRISFVGVLVLVALWTSIAVHNNLTHVQVASFHHFLQDETYASSGTASSNISFKRT
jgi:uncharacterized membrane protein YcaP (DUF421 family)